MDDNNSNSNLSPSVKILSTSEEVYRMFFSSNGNSSANVSSTNSNSNNNAQNSNSAQQPQQPQQHNNSQPHKQQSQLPGIQPSIRLAPASTANLMNMPFDIKHRKRTSREQLQVLEKSFSENPRPTSEQRKELAMLLDMTPRGVQIWFQNRRAKLKTKTRDEEHFNSLRRSKELGLNPNPNLGLGMVNQASQQQCSSNVNSASSLSYSNQLHHQHQQHHQHQLPHQQQAPFAGRISSILTPQLSPLIPPFYAGSGTIGGPGAGQGNCPKYTLHTHPYPLSSSSNSMFQAQQGHPMPPWQQRPQKKPNTQQISTPASGAILLHRDVMHDIEEAIMNSNFDFFKKENNHNHNIQCSGPGSTDSQSSILSSNSVNNGGQMIDHYSNGAGSVGSVHHTIYYDPFPTSTPPHALPSTAGNNGHQLSLKQHQRPYIDPGLSMFCKGGVPGSSGKSSGTSNGTSGAVVNAEELLSEYINYANN
jgi:hypothetical protein